MSDRAQRPFWFHQLTEYLIGFALIVFGFQDTDPAVPAVAGIVVLLNATVVDGPFGAFKFVRRGFHKYLDLAVMAFLVVAAFQPWFPVSQLGMLVLVGVVIPYAFGWFYTDWAERAGRKQRRAARASAGSEDIGKTAGRYAASGYLAAKRAIRKHTDSDSDSAE